LIVISNSNNNSFYFTHCQDENDSYPIYCKENNFQDVKNFLGSWSVQFNVPHNALNALIKCLKMRKNATF
jgi:hypothetical protein